MMGWMAAALMFALPLGVIGIVAAVTGFLCRPLQPLLLVAMAVGVGWLCNGLAAGDGFAPMTILPLLLAVVIALCASIAVRRGMEHGYRVEADISHDAD